ncbi:uncharacterized protein LOC107871885 [Capsicum annuum]|uniref:uncharacterized protein LOC107871885 n=1 Tax=Capsicum annuum TaxID=4072 RepID=UPI001FB06C43|nr:uncharacterized protein LOC107871885 [Capsicum annuum]
MSAEEQKMLHRFLKLTLPRFSSSPGDDAFKFLTAFKDRLCGLGLVDTRGTQFFETLLKKYMSRSLRDRLKDQFTILKKGSMTITKFEAHFDESTRYWLKLGIYSKFKFSSGAAEDLASSFFGVLFIFQPVIRTQAWNFFTGAFPSSTGVSEFHIFAVLVSLFSSVASGVTYCLTRAGAKAADQPVLPVLMFALFASPAAAKSSFAFENFALPSFYSFLLMAVLGVLGFFAEILLARGLQLEKTNRVANIQFVEVALSQFLGMGSTRIVPSFCRLVGRLIILISVCCTMYIGPEKEIE